MKSDRAGIDAALISSATCCPSIALWYGGPNAVNNAIGYAEHRGHSHPAVIRVYDVTGNMIEMHDHIGAFKE